MISRVKLCLPLVGLVLTGCAASPPAVGNSKGGVIQWFRHDRHPAWRAADSRR
jgi:hypothetical protein